MNIIKAPIESVVPWDKNPRGIKTKDYDRLKKQITKLGVYKPLIAFKEDGKYIVLGGNMRIRALKEMGLKEVDISVVDPKTEAQKIEFALSDNDRAGFYEEDKLAELVYPHIKDIDLGDFKVDLGEALDLKQVVERYGPDIDDGADEVPEIDDTPAITKMGDLFTLGRHRVMCGDSTKAEDVARLMNGEKAGAVITDPPYGLGDKKSFNADHADYADGEPFDLRRIDLSVPFVVWGGNYYDPIPQPRNKIGWIVWDKRPNLDAEKQARADRIFGQHFEIAITTIGDLRGKMLRHRWGGYYGTEQIVHKTQKPISLMVDCINPTTGTVVDYFLGSGTTLIAAEKLNRVCFGLEIDPRYCDVIIKRYVDYTKTDEAVIRKTIEHEK